MPLFRRNKNKDSSAEKPAGGGPPRMFMGALPSDLDEDQDLPEEFSELIRRHNMLLQAYADGRMSPKLLAEQMAELVVVDEAGSEWTIGAMSGQWYRRVPGGRWSPSPPPVEVVVAEDLEAREGTIVSVDSSTSEEMFSEYH